MAPDELHALIPDHAHPYSHPHLDEMYDAMVSLWGDAFTKHPAGHQVQSILVAWNEHEIGPSGPRDIAERVSAQAAALAKPR